MKDVFEALVLFTNYAILALAELPCSPGLGRVPLGAAGGGQPGQQQTICIDALHHPGAGSTAGTAGGQPAGPLPGRAALRPLVFLGCVAVVCLVLRAAGGAAGAV